MESHTLGNQKIFACYGFLSLAIYILNELLKLHNYRRTTMPEIDLEVDFLEFLPQSIVSVIAWLYTIMKLAQWLHSIISRIKENLLEKSLETDKKIKSLEQTVKSLEEQITLQDIRYSKLIKILPSELHNLFELKNETK